MQESNIFLYLVSFFVIFEFLWAIYLFIKTKSFIKNSSQIKANIVDVKLVRKGTDMRSQLSVTFRDQYGKDVSAQLLAGGSNKYNSGDLLDILFLKSDPQKIKINSWSSLYLPSCVILAWAVMAVLVGLFLYSEGIL